MEHYKETHRAKLNWLPDIPILRIAAYLDTKYLISFSQTCKSVFHICNNIWQVKLKRSVPEFSQLFKDLASALPTNNSSRLALLLYNTAQQNWNDAKSVRVMTLESDSHKIELKNFSTHLVLLKKSLQPTEQEWEWRFSVSLWDMISQTSKDLMATITLENNQLGYPRIALYNNCIMVNFSSPMMYIGFRMNLNEMSLDVSFKNWHQMIGGHRLRHTEVFETFYVIVDIVQGRQIQIIMKGFNIEDGKKLFHRKILETPGEETFSEFWFQYMSFAGSNDGWFVVSLPESYFAMNYKKNIYKRIKGEPPEDSDHVEMNLKDGKLLCLYQKINYFELFDLNSGDLLYKVPLVSSSSLNIDFNPKTNEIVTLENHFNLWSLKVFNWTLEESPPVLTELNYQTFGTGCNLKVMLNNLMWMEISESDSYRLWLVPLSQVGKGRILLHEGKCHQLEQLRYPFFIAMQGQNFVKIVDFLRLDKYL